MDLVKFENVSLHNGEKDILLSSSFSIVPGRIYGLIGSNGTGKTTLIRLIMKQIEADKGSILCKPKLSIGLVPQQPQFNPEQNIEDFLLSKIVTLMEKLRQLEVAMSENPQDTALLNSYALESDKFEQAGGYGAIEQAESFIRRLGLDNPLEQTMGTLSGGERSLVFFAREIISSPELLILDEPGNHLDYLGLAWLESFLQAYKGTVLMVSHNRYLLDKTCQEILDLDSGNLTVFSGNYSSYKIEKTRKALTDQQKYESSLRKIEELGKRFKQLQSVATSQYNPPATVMNQLKAVGKKLEQEKSNCIHPKETDETHFKFTFGKNSSRSHIAMQITDFSLGFTDNPLFEDVSLEISCGEKLALTGPNGCGKTTFLKTVLAKASWDNQKIRIGPSQKIGYLSQNPHTGFTKDTIITEIRSWGSLTEEEAFALARPFSFRYEDLKKPLEVLSGGEINRLQLARLMYQECNFLILDEPTNHMDIASREAIEQALLRFKGTLLVISHDRYFLDRLVTRVVEINNKTMINYPGNFSDYFKKRYPVLPRLSGRLESRGTERKKVSKTPPSTSMLETRITEYEAEKILLEGKLKESLSTGKATMGQKIAVKLEKLEKRLNHFYEEWEESLE